MLDSIRQGRVDSAEISQPNFIDEIILKMKPNGVADEPRYIVEDKRKPNAVIPLELVWVLGIAAKMKIHTSLTDIPYAIMDARIEILEMRRDRLLGYLETATLMEDIIQLEAELSDVLYELDQYLGSKRGMDNLVEYARVSVNLNEIITAETITSNGDPLGDRVTNAYRMSLNNVGSFLQESAVGFAAASPVLILLAVIAAIVFAALKAVRLLMKKWRAKYPKKQAPPPGGM